MSKKTKQIIKWGIAVFLAVVVVLAFVLSKSADRILRATEFQSEEEAAAEEDTAEESDVEEDTVTLTIPAEAPDGEEEESSAEGESGEEAETGDQDADSDEEIPEPEVSAQKQEEKEEPSAQENEDGDAEDERDPIECPAQVLRAIAPDGAQVIVEAPEGCLPAGSYVTVSILSSDEAAEAVESALEDSSEVVDIVLYDIVICAADGTEIQPDARVRVSIIAPDNKGDSTSVYHVTDDGQAEKVGDGDAEGGVSFDTENF